jgi:hypothetical protein
MGRSALLAVVVQVACHAGACGGEAAAKRPVAARFAHEIEPNELPRDESGQPTVMDHAIRVEPGEFLIIRHGKRLVALRVLRHTKHSTASGKTVAGAVVEYFLSADGKLAGVARHEAKVAEDYEDQRFLYVHIPGLRLE